MAEAVSDHDEFFRLAVYSGSGSVENGLMRLTDPHFAFYVDILEVFYNSVFKC